METVLIVSGKKAEDLAKSLGLTKSGDTTDLNTKMQFEYQVFRGTSTVEVSFST
jgi:hypothetical protein